MTPRQVVTIDRGVKQNEAIAFAIASIGEPVDWNGLAAAPPPIQLRASTSCCYLPLRRGGEKFIRATTVHILNTSASETCQGKISGRHCTMRTWFEICSRAARRKYWGSIASWDSSDSINGDDCFHARASGKSCGDATPAGGASPATATENAQRNRIHCLGYGNDRGKAPAGSPSQLRISRRYDEPLRAHCVMGTCLTAGASRVVAFAGVDA
jgi:hypothetical protein